jgi:hypothetical protein
MQRRCAAKNVAGCRGEQQPTYDFTVAAKVRDLAIVFCNWLEIHG